MGGRRLPQTARPAVANGRAPCKAHEKRQNKTAERKNANTNGDIFNELTRVTFRKSFDTTLLERLDKTSSGIVGMRCCGVFLSTGWMEPMVVAQCGLTGCDGVYASPNCAMISVRAYEASRWLREPDENQVEAPPRFDLHPQPSSRSSTLLLASLGRIEVEGKLE